MKNEDLQFNKNEDQNLLLLSEVRTRLEKIKMGGGKKSIEKQHERGKLSARERISYLLDKEANFFELGAFAGYEMYAEQGGCPAAGVVVVIGYVSGKQCIVVANDATVKAGAWFPITAKKNLRAQEIAMENRGTSGSVQFLFDRKGVFKIAREGVNLEDLELELIDYGAEEILEGENELYIYTKFADFGSMQKGLEAKGITPISSEKQWIPLSTKEVSEAEEEDVARLIGMLEDDDDVIAVYHSMA